MNDLHVKCFLYADDHVILASLAEQLQDMVTLMNEAFKRKGMNVNVNKTRVMLFERDEDVSLCYVEKRVNAGNKLHAKHESRINAVEMR